MTSLGALDLLHPANVAAVVHDEIIGTPPPLYHDIFENYQPHSIPAHPPYPNGLIPHPPYLPSAACTSF